MKVKLLRAIIIIAFILVIFLGIIFGVSNQNKPEEIEVTDIYKADAE